MLIRKWIAAMPVALAASLLIGTPGMADPVTLAAQQPGQVDSQPVPGRAKPADLSQGVDTNAAIRGGKIIRWPAAGKADGVNVGAAEAKAGQLPIFLGRAKNPGKVGVEVLDRAKVPASWRDGMVFRISGSTDAEISVDYTTFEGAYGGDFAGRLKLVRLPECALSTPEAAGCQPEEVKTKLDRDTKRVRTEAGVAQAKAADGPELQAAGAGTTIMALTAGGSSDTGDYAATKLQASSSWTAGGSSGDFSWNYPLAMPPGNGGPSPSISMAYSSSAVDGRSNGTNNQPSWVGQGFEYTPGHIERRYTPCADDMGGPGANNTTKTGDLCWGIDNASFSLNGRGGELIKDDTTGVWKLKNDDGSRVERLDDTANAGDNTVNGAWNNEYWKVTTADGTQYFFGLNRLKGWASGNATTESVFTVPVAGNNTGERCKQSGFVASFCTQAWRWNLDYVVDPHGNTMSYSYTKFSNKYARNNTATDVVSYDRDGVLKRIDYGTDNRSGTDTVYTATKAPMQIDFETGDRCVTASCGTHDAVNWPDTPYDQECTGSNCAGKGSPVFFSTTRLKKVTTKVWGGADYRLVDSWAFTHQFPPTGSGTPAGLWLESIVRTGHAGATPITMPEINFDWVALENRVDTYNGNKPTLNWHRMSTIWTEMGGKISVRYSDKDCSATNLPSAAHTNTKRCYPVLFEENDVIKTEYFHKYLVTEIYEADLTAGGVDKVSKYEYVGTPAWRFTDDNGITKDKFRTWSDYRGYATVRFRLGAPGKETLTESKYMRGMHDSKDTPSGGKRISVSTAAIGPSLNDDNAFNGVLREQTEYNGVDTAPVSRSVNVPWQSNPTSTRDMGDTTVYSRYTGTSVKFTSTYLDAGRGWRTSKTTTSYDSLGLADYTTDHGEVSPDGATEVPGDEMCTDNTYVHNTAANIIGQVQRSQTFALACGTAPTSKAQVVADARSYFDGQAYGATPQKGLVTQTDTMKDWVAASGTVFVTSSRSAFDVHGRPKQLWDARGNVSTTTYTPATGGPVTKVEVAGPLGTSSEDRDPAWGHALSKVDVNGKRVDIEFDALGRITKVWKANRAKASYPTSPSLQYAYVVRNTGGPNVVTTNELNANGNYIVGYELYDGLVRPRQVQKPANGGGGTVFTETIYDEAGRAVIANQNFYDSAVVPSGNLRTVLDWENKSQSVTEYDRAGRPTANITKSSGQEKYRTTTGYGGDRTYSTPPTGGTPTTTISDVRGAKTELRQHTGATTNTPYDKTTYHYNGKRQLDEVTDAANNKWLTEYDMANRTSASVDPDKGRTEFRYNDYNDLIEQTDARTEKLVFEYDSLGRKKATYDDAIAPANKRASWEYDPAGAKGQLASASRWTGPTRTNEYKMRIRGYTSLYSPTGEDYTIPASETGLAGTYTFTRTYKVDGSPATLGYPNAFGLGGETVTYTYDDTTGMAEQVQTNWPGAGQYVTNMDYTAFGELAFAQYQQTAGNWLQRAYVYDEIDRDQVQDTVVRQVAPQILADRHYDRDDAGNVKKIANTPAGGSADVQCFTPDHVGRLTKAWTPADGNCNNAAETATLGGPAPYRYVWDITSAGNRLSETGVGTASTFTYPGAGQVRAHAVTAVTTTGTGAGTKNYGYDVAGNMTCRPVPGAVNNTCGVSNSQVLVWDAEGMLESLGSSSNVYNADGQRIIARDANGTTLYLPNTEFRRATSGTVTATRYYANETSTFAMRTVASGVTWLVSDHHGTQSLSVAAGNQAITQRYVTPYGGSRGPAVTWPNSKGFVGGDVDSTGLTHIGAREYDPSLGKFASVDPMFNKDEPNTMNNYAYAGNSPVTESDPTGACIPDDTTGRCIPGTQARPGGGGGGTVCSGGCGGKPNPKMWWDLGWQWLRGYRQGCGATEARNGPNGSCYVTEYFSDGDGFTQKIKQLPHMEIARYVIAQELAKGATSGRADMHNADLSKLGKAIRYRDDMMGSAAGVFEHYTGIDPLLGPAELGGGSPDPAFFLGSFDLEWSVVGHDDKGTPVIEFKLTNASTWASAVPDPRKIIKYSAGGMAGDGNDAEPGEKWLQQVVTWREPIPVWVAPQPMPGPPATTPSQVLGTPQPTPGPRPS